MATRVRRVFRIVSDMFDCPDEQDAIAVGLRGMAKLVGAQVGIFAELADFVADGSGRVDSVIDVGWSSARQRSAAVHPYLTSGCGADPSARRLLQLRPKGVPCRGVTARRSELVSNRVWYESDFFNEARRPADIDHLVHSISADGEGEGRVSGLTFIRPLSDRDFSSDDVGLISLFHEEALPLWHRRRSQKLDSFVKRFSFTTREEQTARALLTARSEREIAGDLSISPHTCHQYVKAVYKKSKTNSRAQFLALALSWIDSHS